MEGCVPISYPSGLPTAFQICEQSWWSSSLLSTGIYGLMSVPLPNVCKPSGHSVKEAIYGHYTSLGNLHPYSVDAPVDVHGRSHSFPFIHPRGVFLAWCWVITRPLSSCCIVLLSLPLGVGLTGVGLVHLSHTWHTPTHKGTPPSDAMRRNWLQCRTCEFPCWSFTLYVGTSVCNLTHHLMRLDLPFVHDLPLPLKGACLD